MKTFITSFNEKLYNSYGKKFIQSWKEHAQQDVKLIVCFEGEISDEIIRHTQDNLTIIGINTQKQSIFFNKFGRLNEARGIRLAKNPLDPKTLNFNYNYRFDAIRFSFKIFSFVKCMELNLINTDFAWLDADVVCLKDFDSDDMNNFFPAENQLASYLGRSKYPLPNPYSECGFVGYNYYHPKCLEFIDSMYKLYENGDIFSLKEWHDCMVFDHVRNINESLGVEFKNLSAEFLDSDHPFMLTGLSHFFDHLKGPERKKIGHS
jgi:hypothetical protein